MRQKKFNNKILPLSSKIYSYSYRILGNKDDAKDVVQDIMLKLWDNRKDLDKYDNPTGYIMRTTRNYCIDIIRKNKKHMTEEVNESHMINFFHEDKKIEIDESVKYIRKIIKTLPSVQQEVVVLKDFEGFSNEEISEITSLGENNIRVILSRCRKHIKEQLINKYDIKNPL